MTMTTKQIMGWTQGFIVDSQQGTTNNFIAACLTKGGAEGWVQVELDRVYKKLPGNPAVLREQSIYTNKQLAVDFLIINGKDTLCIELKVESLYQSAGDGRVTIPHGGAAKVIEDVTKLSTERNEKYASDSACVLVITWSEELKSSLEHVIKQQGLMCMQEMLTVRNESEYNVNIFVIEVS